MSASNQSDPRLLLPEWLRDGDLPAAAEPPNQPAPVEPTARLVPATAPSAPFSDRLSLDTRLDPGLLVSATDLPKWLGGLERAGPAIAQRSARPEAEPKASIAARSIEGEEPVEDIEPSQDGVIDVQVTNWMMIAGAVGLLILLLAALELYLS